MILTLPSHRHTIQTHTHSFTLIHFGCGCGWLSFIRPLYRQCVVSFLAIHIAVGYRIMFGCVRVCLYCIANSRYNMFWLLRSTKLKTLSDSLRIVWYGVRYITIYLSALRQCGAIDLSCSNMCALTKQNSIICFCILLIYIIILFTNTQMHTHTRHVNRLELESYRWAKDKSMYCMSALTVVFSLSLSFSFARGSIFYRMAHVDRKPNISV